MVCLVQFMPLANRSTFDLFFFRHMHSSTHIQLKVSQFNIDILLIDAGNYFSDFTCYANITIRLTINQSGGSQCLSDKEIPRKYP